MSHSASAILRPQLFICIFLKSDTLSRLVLQGLSPDRYAIATPASIEEFFQFIDQEKQQLDCLLLEADAELPYLANWLHGQATLLPAVILEPTASGVSEPTETPLEAKSYYFGDPTFAYHTAEVRLTADQLDKLDRLIERAITQFLNLSPTCRWTNTASVAEVNHDLTTQNFLMLQQRRLTEKLKERLGYLGVYYKRNPKNFFRYLSPEQKQELLDKLKEDYREIVLRYFVDDGTLNQRIDDFVNTTFFADISVSQVVETHMELMDEFSKQLKLEGRSEDILLDYRLTLIDTIAHLCEMYRRSIPRES